MATNNSTILGKFLLSGTDDRAQRLGFEGTVGTAQVQRLFDPMNQDIYNSFCTFMINRVGYDFVHQQQWENPLKEFFKQKVYYGNTVEETMLGWIKGHSYDVDIEDQFKTYYPDGLQAFHSVNHKVSYPNSVSREQMRRACGDEQGLARLIAAVMQQPRNADEYDIYDEMLSLFPEMDSHYGLHRTTLTGAPTDKAGCDELLEKLQAFAYDITVPSTEYGQTEIPVFAKPEELVLFVRSSVMAKTNVQSLAAAYNLEKVDIQYRLKVIPDRKWPLGDDDYAILTTSDFFQCYPIEYLTTSQVDPSGLKTNFWLHDWCIISASPFVPITVFSTKTSAGLDTVTFEPSKLTVTASADSANPGDVIELYTDLEGTVTPITEGVTTAPDGVLWDVTAKRGADALALNARTCVIGKQLHIQKSGLKTGDVITATGTSVYLNPSGDTKTYSDSVDITIL